MSSTSITSNPRIRSAQPVLSLQPAIEPRRPREYNSPSDARARGSASADLSLCQAEISNERPPLGEARELRGAGVSRGCRGRGAVPAGGGLTVSHDSRAIIRNTYSRAVWPVLILNHGSTIASTPRTRDTRPRRTGCTPDHSTLRPDARRGG